jgi:hypothetical protein
MSREHGFSVENFRALSVNLYPSPIVYVDGYEDHDNPKCEEVWDWATTWTERAKMQFPTCTFSTGTGIHDSDYRVYAEVKISGPDCREAAEWLGWKTE